MVRSSSQQALKCCSSSNTASAFALSGHRAVANNNKAANCVVNALVDATPISRPARVKSVVSASRTMVLDAILHTAKRAK